MLNLQINSPTPSLPQENLPYLFILSIQIDMSEQIV